MSVIEVMISFFHLAYSIILSYEIQIKHKNKESPCLFLKYIAFNTAFRKMALLRLTPVVYYISLNLNMFLWFNFWNILHVCILNTNTWIGIITFWGHHAFKFGIIYSDGGHIGFYYTSLIGRCGCLNLLVQVCYMANQCVKILHGVYFKKM